MDDERPLFILAGNNPYENRGCEAIVRGTVEILRTQFNDPRFICISHYQNMNQYRQQCLQEADEAITHLHSYRLNKKKIIQNFWKPFYLGYAYDHFRRPGAIKYKIYKQMLPYLEDTAAILSIGGDNYSLDYGVPKLFTDLDDIAIQNEKPVILWGASVGPFSAMPNYEQYMSDHLQKVTAIFARESVTIEYLKSIDVSENVYQVADPAFLMDPVKPEGIEDVLHLDEEAIGLNFSPLMANYVTEGDLDAWTNMVASIIEGVAQKTGMPVYLIPHVTIPISNDYTFMKEALSRIQNDGITLVPPIYDAAEIKWIISQMALFAGARTHSTIAALSTCVPTLSFAYSIKAKGIVRDIFNHERYVHTFEDLKTEVPINKIASMVDCIETINKELEEKTPEIKKTALKAGIYFKNQLKGA